MPRRILISGGAGFIGSRVALRLAGEGWDVRVLDNLSPQVHGPAPERSRALQELKRAADFVHGDVRDPEAWARSLTGRTHVLHLAAETGTAQSGYSAARYCEANVVGTANLLDALVGDRLSLVSLVVASSRAIYGEGRGICPTHGPVDAPARRRADLIARRFEPRCPRCGETVKPAPTSEEARPAPSSVYAVTKLAQEQLVLQACRSLGQKGTALRYQNVYGAGQSMRNPYAGILPLFAGALMSGERLPIFEDGRQTRDFVHVSDVVTATCRAVSDPPNEPLAINVGSGTTLSLLDLLGEMERSLGCSADVEMTGEFRNGDIRHNVADLERARALLGFAPRTSLRDGLTEFLAWSRGESKVLAGFADRHAAAIAEMRRHNLLR